MMNFTINLISNNECERKKHHLTVTVLFFSKLKKKFTVLQIIQ